MTGKAGFKLFVLCLVLAVSAGVPFLDGESSQSSAGGTIAGSYVWLTGARADARQAECDLQAAGTDCVELCMTSAPNSVVSMNRYCCLDPALIGGWDNPMECELWID